MKPLFTQAELDRLNRTRAARRRALEKEIDRDVAAYHECLKSMPLGRVVALPPGMEYRWSPLSLTVAGLCVLLGFILGTLFGYAL